LSERSEVTDQIREQFLTDPLYFSRNYGLVHICFPDQVPTAIGSYSKFASVCITNPDYLPDASSLERYNSVQTQRLWFMRSMVVVYVIGLCLCALSMLVGIFGCYKRSPNLILVTALILTLAVLSLFTSMMFWHLVNYYERKVLTVAPFYTSWTQVLKQTTRISYGWSYSIAWAGIMALIFADVSLYYSKCAIKAEEESMYENKHAAYFQQYYGGGGGIGTNSEKSLVPSVSYGGAPYGNPYGSIYGVYGPPSAYYGQYAAPGGYYGYGYGQ